MGTNHGFYNSYDSDQYEPGVRLKVEHSIYATENADISQLTSLPISELQTMRETSDKTEKKAFEKVCAAATDWESKAANTLLLDKAIEYLKIPPVKHTSNEWQQNKYDDEEISNMVYKMYIHVREDTKYNRETKEDKPVVWYVSWDVCTNNPSSHELNQYIAGQNGKRFTEKAAAEKYIAGRKSVYADLFSEISPPLPKDLAHNFIVNNQLLPGYTVQLEQPEKSVETPSKDKKSSVLDKLAAAINESNKSCSKPDKNMKPNNHEL